MDGLKAENSKLLETQLSNHKKITRLESENEELKNENVKMKIKFENFQKSSKKNKNIVFIFYKN